MATNYGLLRAKMEQLPSLTPLQKASCKIDAKVNGANRLKFTPDGKLAFISSLQSGELTVYDTKTGKK